MSHSPSKGILQSLWIQIYVVLLQNLSHRCNGAFEKESTINTPCCSALSHAIFQLSRNLLQHFGRITKSWRMRIQEDAKKSPLNPSLCMCVCEDEQRHSQQVSLLQAINRTIKWNASLQQSWGRYYITRSLCHDTLTEWQTGWLDCLWCMLWYYNLKVHGVIAANLSYKEEDKSWRT